MPSAGRNCFTINYVAELRRIAERYRFGDYLESVLCDRLVCGIQDARIQQWLLEEPDLTFRQAFNLAPVP